MTTITTRERLHKQIEELPDALVEQISDFVQFLTRKKASVEYIDWSGDYWRQFALEQFFREDDEVQYTLQDAKEIYNP